MMKPCYSLLCNKCASYRYILWLYIIGDLPPFFKSILAAYITDTLFNL